MKILRRKWIGILTVSVLLAGCGFKIRGFDLGLPFQTIAVEGGQGVAEEVRQMILGQPGTKVVKKSIEAQVILIIESQQMDRVITAFSGSGRPREIQLRMRVRYRVTDSFGVELSLSQEIAQTRDITFNESESLALATSENLFITEMQQDTALQIVRRLRAIKIPS